MPTKFRTSILIFGITVMCLLACLATFLVLAASGVLVTEKAKVEITVQAATKIYDGTPLTANEYQIEGELAEGHRAVVSFTDSQTDAGEGESGAEVRILDEDGYDVTNTYAIKVNKGLLRVTRQSLSVAIGDKEVVYNGEKVIFDDYILQRGALAKGHKIGAAASVGVIKPGAVNSSALTPAVYDAFGNDVTKNYDISFAMGTVQVIPRPLVVRACSETKAYDGKPLFASRVEIASGSLIAGHEIRVSAFQTASGETAQLTEVGKIPVYISAYSVYDAKGENVSEYYKVTADFGNPGTLEVTPRELTVVGKSKSWEYDGKAHGFTSYSGREDTETSAEMALGLAEGHSVRIAYDSLRDAGNGNKLLNSITDTGTQPCYINSENVRVLDAESNDKTGNYQITYVNGTLTVTPQNLRITIKDYTVEYNEKAIPEETLKEQLVLFQPFEAEDFRLVMSEKEYKNAGVYSLSAEPYVNENPTTDEEAQEEAARKKLFKNYKLDIVPATVTITKKPLDITVNSFMRDYTGQEVDDATILTNVTLADEFDKDSLEVVKEVTKIVDAGTYRITVKFKDNKAPGTDDFDSKNYELAIIPGTLTINKKRVSVLVLNHTVEYSGTRVPDAELQKLIVCGEGLDATDFKISGVPEGGFINVKSYVVSAEFDANKAGNAEKLKNYEPSITPGTLTITKKSVAVDINNAEHEYSKDANAYAATLQGMISCKDTALAPTPTAANAMLEPVVKGELKNAGNYIVSAKLKDNILDDVKNNFELNVTVGSFTVLPKTLTVTLQNHETTFSGEGVKLDNIPDPTLGSGETLGTGETLKILSSSIEGSKNAGDYVYTAEAVVMEGGKVSPNYTVRAQAGEWKIKPLEVNVTAGGEITKVYDGKPIEIDGSMLQVEGVGDSYSVISAEYDKNTQGTFDDKAFILTLTLNLQNIRIRDNATGHETFNLIAKSTTVDVKVTQRKLQIYPDSITVSQGTDINEIVSIVQTGGVSYTLIGLADSDFAEVTFTVQGDMESGAYVIASIGSVTDKFGEDVTQMYQIEEGRGTVFFI